MEHTKENKMTLDDFQKKLFWISLLFTTVIITAYIAYFHNEIK